MGKKKKSKKVPKKRRNKVSQIDDFIKERWRMMAESEKREII